MRSGKKTPKDGLYSNEMKIDPLDLVSKALGYSIKRAQVHAYELFFEFLGDNAISPARMTALSIIGTHPGITQSALAKKLGISRAGIVKVVDWLESLNLVERRSKQSDRRSNLLYLTDSGQDELSWLAEQSKEYEKILASKLTDEERDQLIRLLEKVTLSRCDKQATRKTPQ
ncbi:MarR family winged helix-turn-helix transcriptional regulator [Marinomonas spartinae]|uniref:MarR family winged helix-turn-helix transcriptional regulator n=1 Tax=Marinomonas spartinae TaxID=1792290 RepID=UPI0018F232BB|nr:MarR family transcriptional regulator [Marinomonas spartinae]MBJ7556462.1 MarR family transcriptional regulator [Marinomonas spartinae]